VRVIPPLLLVATAAGCYHPAPLDERAILDELRAARPATPAPAGGTTPGAVSEEAAVATAMAGNPDVLVARAAVPIARAGVRKASAWKNPQLRVSNEDAVDAFERERVTIGLRWYLPHPAVHVAAVEAAEAVVPEAEASADEVAWNVRRDTRAAYAHAVFAARKAALMAERAEARRQAREVAAAGVEKGLLDPSEGTRAELRWLQARDDEGRAAADARRAHALLARVMGLGDASALILNDPGPAYACPAPASDEAAIEDQVLASHPEVRRTRTAYARAEAELKLEHSRWIPWFEYFQLGYEYDYDPGRSGVHFGFALDLPFLDWNKGGIAVAEARREQERLRFRESVAESLGQIRAGLASWREAAARRERISSSTLPATSAAVGSSSDAVARGRSGETFALEARERDVEARVAELEAVLACRLAAIEVEHACGVPLLTLM
jgi:outer membrane protein TolC